MMSMIKRQLFFYFQKGLLLLTLNVLLLLFVSFQGFSYQQLNLPDSLSVYLLEVDPQKCLITPAHAYWRGIGRQTVQEIAASHHALAAVNGGFFKSKPWEGLPAGILKIDHQWLAWPSKPRGAIGWSEDDNDLLFDRLFCKGAITVLDQSFIINGLNRLPEKSEIIVFTPAFYSSTLTPCDGFEVIIQHNRLILVKEGGNSGIPSNGYVISFSSKEHLAFWQSIQQDIPIDVEITILPQLSPFLAIAWDQLSHILGGTPLLIYKGNIITDFSSEQTLKSFIDQPHTRTAIGLLPNGHWLFVVVEGQMGSIKLGVTIPELVDLMAEFGCIEALNLDGGGSSTMVIEGKVVNHPHGDKDEDLGLFTPRRVSDAILIKARP